MSKSVQTLAYHEQVNILQPAIYDDWRTQRALDANQFAWVTKLPTGDFAEIQLTLSAQCSAKPGLTVWFPKKDVSLYKVDDRMKFVYQAAAEFDKLLRGKSRDLVERSIKDIYRGSVSP